MTSRLDPGVAKLAIWVVSLGLMSVALDCQAVPSAPAHIATELPSARLAGQGAYRWFGLKIYQAQLWIGSQGFQPAAPGTARFALDLHQFYRRNVIAVVRRVRARVAGSNRSSNRPSILDLLS